MDNTEYLYKANRTKNFKFNNMNLKADILIQVTECESTKPTQFLFDSKEDEKRFFNQLKNDEIVICDIVVEASALGATSFAQIKEAVLNLNDGLEEDLENKLKHYKFVEKAIDRLKINLQNRRNGR